MPKWWHRVTATILIAVNVPEPPASVQIDRQRCQNQAELYRSDPHWMLVGLEAKIVQIQPSHVSKEHGDRSRPRLDAGKYGCERQQPEQVPRVDHRRSGKQRAKQPVAPRDLLRAGSSEMPCIA